MRKETNRKNDKGEDERGMRKKRKRAKNWRGLARGREGRRR